MRVINNSRQRKDQRGERLREFEMEGQTKIKTFELIDKLVNKNVVMKSLGIKTQIQKKQLQNRVLKFDQKNYTQIRVEEQRDIKKYNLNNISEIISKEAVSQTNNLSILQTSFFTGYKHEKIKDQTPQLQIRQNQQIQSEYNFQKQTYQSFMKYMRQQINIIKQNYQKKILDILKVNTQSIIQLRDKIKKNQLLIKQRQNQIYILLQKQRNNQLNKINKVNFNCNENMNLCKFKDYPIVGQNEVKKEKKNEGYDNRKLKDVEIKLSILRENMIKLEKDNKVQKRVQILERGILSIFQSKTMKMENKLKNFILRYEQKMSELFRKVQNVTMKASQLKKQLQAKQILQTKFNDIGKKFKQIQKQINLFMSKQFKYQNYQGRVLQQILNNIKQDIKLIENQQQQNLKLIKYHTNQFHKINSNNSPIISIYQNQIKSYQTNPALSKISISQLSNTDQYSQLIQKMSSKFQCNPKNDSSIISMNLTQQYQSALIYKQNGSDNLKTKTNIQLSSVSKFTKTSDMKETKCPLQNSPLLNKNYFLGGNNKKNYFVQKQKDKPIQDKIKILNCLKMQSRQITPQKQSNLDLKNNSFWSVSQMEDFNASKIFLNQTHDFTDDQFFYPSNGAQSINIRQKKLIQRNKQESPSKNSRESEISKLDDFSPMKRKEFYLTQQNFYLSNRRSNNTLQMEDKNRWQMNKNLYNSNLDYESFEEQEEERQYKIRTEKKDGKEKNLIEMMKDLTRNEKRLMERCRGLQQKDLPVKVVYDKRKKEGCVRLQNTRHELNGQTFTLQKAQLQNLQRLGIVQVKTYI